MTLDAAALRKVLDLEKKKGFSDRAVIGGLDRYLRNWAVKADGLASPALFHRLKELGLLEPRYSTWDQERRQQWVEEVLAFLEGLEKAPPSPATLPSPPPRPRPRAHRPPPSLDSPLPGPPSLVGRLSEMGVKTVRDILYFFPRRHLDYSQTKKVAELEVGKEQTVKALVWEASRKYLGQKEGTEAIVGDDTGNIRVVWFNQPYLARSLKPNTYIVLSGRVEAFKERKVLENPAWEPLEEELVHTGRLVPLYPLTQGLRPRPVRKMVKEVADAWAPRLPDFLPPGLVQECQLLPLGEAIHQAHFPRDHQTFQQARQRLAFDELLLLQLGMLSRKREWQVQPGPDFHPQPQALEAFLEGLPFALTAAQERAWEGIEADLLRPQPMSRLLQGEVGSGKTVVAAMALILAWANGWQGALMAPTEVLAEQHLHSIGSLLSRAGGEGGEGSLRRFSLPSGPFTMALLTGSLSSREKEAIRDRLGRGEIDIVLGTHALIQRDVAFRRLGLVVVDEQHRFGVLQRSALKGKGLSPHVLVMTATPIPRSLALTFYGDLDLSAIDQLPPGRQEVKTSCLGPEERPQAYAFIRRHIAQGEQAFIICPLIEESEAVSTPAAVVEYERLSREVFPDLRLGLLHGRLGLEEKEEVMRRFRQGKLDILVATPVVEVGIDVPNATVMLVEGAERFGLAQLHQFRGRVGRGEKPGYCLLLSVSPSPEAQERLRTIERVRDGFLLAEEDLRLRGPGEFFGTRQSGLPDLRMARLSDLPLVEMAREKARALFSRHPALEPYPLLQEELARRWKGAAETG
ncbi:MAG: ATP-dependent DNA helicase RecG [Chloroflexota bacterium]